VGISLVSLVGLLGHIGFGFIRLIGLGDLIITSLFDFSASLARWLIILISLVGLSILWPFKQAALEVAMMQTSPTKIADMTFNYFLPHHITCVCL